MPSYTYIYIVPAQITSKIQFDNYIGIENNLQEKVTVKSYM